MVLRAWLSKRGSVLHRIAQGPGWGLTLAMILVWLFFFDPKNTPNSYVYPQKFWGKKFPVVFPIFNVPENMWDVVLSQKKLRGTYTCSRSSVFRLFFRDFWGPADLSCGVPKCLYITYRYTKACRCLLYRNSLMDTFFFLITVITWAVQHGILFVHHLFSVSTQSHSHANTAKQTSGGRATKWRPLLAPTRVFSVSNFF